MEAKKGKLAKSFFRPLTQLPQTKGQNGPNSNNPSASNAYNTNFLITNGTNIAVSDSHMVRSAFDNNLIIFALNWANNELTAKKAALKQTGIQKINTQVMQLNALRNWLTLCNNIIANQGLNDVTQLLQFIKKKYFKIILCLAKQHSERFD